jgi:hypothetical protein
MGCRKWAQCTPQGRVVQTKCAGNNQAVPLPTPSEITTGELARAVTDHHAYCRLKWTDEKYPLSEAHRTTEGHSLQGDPVGPLQLRWIWKRKNVGHNKVTTQQGDRQDVPHRDCVCDRLLRLCLGTMRDRTMRRTMLAIR